MRKIHKGAYIKCYCGQVLLKCVKDIYGSDNLSDVPLHFVRGSGEPLSAYDKRTEQCPACGCAVDFVHLIQDHFESVA